jgi:bifunctional NMN adenylyltransferase/nudix hydrolase
MAKKDLTVFIGRFSPFHNGHAEVLTRAMQTSKAVLVLVGSAGLARTTKNPFTFDERANMIRNFALKTLSNQIGVMPAQLRIKPLYDHPYNDQAWIRGVQDAVDATKADLVDVIGLNPDVYLTGADRDKSTWYLHAFGDTFMIDTVSESDIKSTFELSATKVRDILFNECSSGADTEMLAASVPATTFEFLNDFVGTDIHANLVKEYEYLAKYKKIYEGLLYPVSIQTVDTCVIQSGHVLVLVRDNFPGRGLWCMPGGHLDVGKNERLVDAAIRELIEETDIGLSRAQLYGSIKSKECFDHPDRSLKARVITMCYLLKLDDLKPLPKIKPQKGEARKVMWVPINEALRRRDMWFDDHHAMLETMYGRLGNL